MSANAPAVRSENGSRPSGVGFRRLEGAPDERFALLLVDDGRSELVAVHDAEDIVAQWQALGKATGLQLLLPCGSGFERLYDSLGAVRLGRVVTRRRHAVLTRRRPRFLVRRKTARLPAPPAVWG